MFFGLLVRLSSELFIHRSIVEDSSEDNGISLTIMTICDLIGVEVTIELLLWLSYVLAHVQLLICSTSLISDVESLFSCAVELDFFSDWPFSKNLTNMLRTMALDNTWLYLSWR